DRAIQYILHHRNNRGVTNNLLEGVALIKQPDNSFGFILTSNSGVRDLLPSTTKVSGTNSWVHVAGTVDRSTMLIDVSGNREGAALPHPYALDYDPTRSWYLSRT